jgi:hypothetical protein
MKDDSESDRCFGKKHRQNQALYYSQKSYTNIRAILRHMCEVDPLRCWAERHVDTWWTIVGVEGVIPNCCGAALVHWRDRRMLGGR